MSERILKHRSLPLAAPESFWTAMGWQVYTNTDEVGYKPHAHEIDRYLALALANGHTGEKALAWAVAEFDRSSEEKTRATAIARHAEAISGLAVALGQKSDADVLAKVMSQLTEPTQWALRKQLAGTGLVRS